MWREGLKNMGDISKSQPSPAQDFVKSLDEKEYRDLIKWAEREIKAYQEFIKLIKSKL